jgi:hypothetical protein
VEVAARRRALEERPREADRRIGKAHVESAGGEIDVDDHATVAVAHAQPAVVELDHHLIAGRECAAGQVELLVAEPSVRSHERASTAVELGDVAAPVGDHDAGGGIARSVPVGHQSTHDVFTAVARDEAPTLRVHVQRLVDGAVAEQLDRIALPSFALTPVLAEDDRVCPGSEHAKCSARLKRGQLAVVADEHELGVGYLRLLYEFRESPRSHHARLIDHHHAVARDGLGTAP